LSLLPPSDRRRDVDKELREAESTQPVGAIVTHRWCGVTFRVEFS
jgi:hypothetical protein